ncbi:hypothetical protein GXW71_15885 [Roseomonas hellenica]|uniref:Uncharacterized protein n=1 Tax=Plastoroseomonas hellenica TaxID=2687306 RepID=A0ABS5EZV9_9PROT|nr:hypothetical protein [Plastoroseomonas hellenica]MBR0665838.1 hypothetical protein [Plastoroseomonas hellenica]
MPLTHVHLNVPLGQKPRGKFACVDSGLVGISTHGLTPFWSTGFSGCVGLVFCGTGQWGALVHLNQAIQNPTKDLALALDMSARFVCGKMNIDHVTEVLIFYGDQGVNYGQSQSLTEHEIKRLLRCQRVIDLRRTNENAPGALDTPFGSDFVYVPKTQTVYTAAAGNALQMTGLDDEDEVVPKPNRSDFPYKEGQEAKLNPGLGHKGWFQVP